MPTDPFNRLLIELKGTEYTVLASLVDIEGYKKKREEGGKYKENAEQQE
jgi:hypothetical protein